MNKSDASSANIPKIGFNAGFGFGLFALLFLFASTIVLPVLLVWKPDAWWVYLVVPTASALGVTALGIYLYRKDVWKFKNYLVVENGRLRWIGKRFKRFDIPIDEISEITFERSVAYENLTIRYGDHKKRQFRMSRAKANKLSEMTGIPLRVEGPTFRESLHLQASLLHQDIIKYRRHIAILTVGAIMTALGFIFHYVFELIWLDCLMSFICYLFGALQFSVFYYLSPDFDTSAWKKPVKIIVPLIVTLAITAIIFGCISVFNIALLKGSFQVDHIFIACYLSSSFILTFCVILVILGILSYGA